MSNNYVPILVCDSRANNFDHYKQPSDFRIQYIIKRGGKISELKSKLIDFLQTVPPHKVPIVKVGVGINDLLNLQSTPKGKVLVPANITKETFLEQLFTFRSEAQQCHKGTQLSYITIPPASFQKFQTERASGEFIDSETLQRYQRDHNNLIVDINAHIRHQNLSQQNSGVSLWTVKWASEIIKSHKRKRGRARKVKVIHDFKFDVLYDGLHGKSDVKRIWFSQLLTGFRADITSLTRAKQVSSESSVSTSEEEDEPIDEGDRCWKRQKLSE